MFEMLADPETSVYPSGHSKLLLKMDHDKVSFSIQMINEIAKMKKNKPANAGTVQWNRLRNTKDNLFELVLESYQIIEPEKSFFDGEAKLENWVNE